MAKTLIAGVGLAALAATAAFAQAPASAPRDGVHTRAEVTQRVQTMFQRLDTNRDGALTQQEVAAVRGQARAQRAQRQADPARQQERLDRGFARMDANKDGSITREEFAQARAHRGERHVMRGMAGKRGMGMGMGMGARMFTMADANRDQRVTLQEATAAALQHFDRADLNRDGNLTREERMQAHQQMRQGRG